jgi:hypothetical protein
MVGERLTRAQVLSTPLASSIAAIASPCSLASE